MGMNRPGRWALKDKRWPALRSLALRRDGWRCVKCGSRHRLEVDHIEAVRDRPDLAFALDNLQVMCGACHARKTRTERGLQSVSAERERWLQAIRNT